MNRPAVTKAHLNRVLDVLQARGLSVAAVTPLTDGSVRLSLTDGSDTVVTSSSQDDDAWKRAAAKWRRSA